MQRLRGRSRFAAVRARGAGGRSGGVRATVLPNGEPCSRVAVAVLGTRTAVERNRARRRLRAAAAPALGIAPGYDAVIQARADAGELPFAVLSGAVSAALAQARTRLPA